MPTKLKDFRENPKRSLYICERFTDELLKRLTPTINALRLDSADPITLYLDSPGGSTEVGQLLKSLLKAPDQDGRSRRLITVATNFVASAAADLLVSGDYSLVYEHARIHYHGTRITHQALTNEAAEEMAQMLGTANAFYAQRLAGIAIYNIAFLANVFRAQIENEKAPGGFVGHFDFVGKLTKFLESKLSVANTDIVVQVRHEILQHQALAIHLLQRLSGVADGPKKALRTLKLIVDWKHKQMSRGGLPCDIDEAFLARVQRSYHDYIRMDRKLFQGEFGRIFRTIGPTLMDKAQQDEFEKLPKADSTRLDFLRQHAFPKFYPLYLFANTLAYRLQKGENELSAVDAYWLGLVNEVVGLSLPCMRDASEMLEDPELPLETPKNP